MVGFPRIWLVQISIWFSAAILQMSVRRAQRHPGRGFCRFQENPSFYVTYWQNIVVILLVFVYLFSFKLVAMTTTV